MKQEKRLTSWIDWYQFAQETLGYPHAEAAVYANLRYLEEQNRQRLRRNRAA